MRRVSGQRHLLPLATGRFGFFYGLRGIRLRLCVACHRTKQPG